MLCFSKKKKKKNQVRNSPNNIRKFVLSYWQNIYHCSDQLNQDLEFQVHRLRNSTKFSKVLIGTHEWHHSSPPSLMKNRKPESVLIKQTTVKICPFCRELAPVLVALLCSTTNVRLCRCVCNWVEEFCVFFVFLTFDQDRTNMASFSRGAKRLFFIKLFIITVPVCSGFLEGQYFSLCPALLKKLYRLTYFHLLSS